MKNATIRSVIVSGALAVIAILVVQSFWLLQVFDHSNQSFNEKVQIALKNTAASLAEVTQVQLPTIDLISRVAHNYYVVNIQDDISPVDLEYYLVREFQGLAINTDFEYGIYDCVSDEMVYGNYVTLEAGKKTLEEQAEMELPKHEGYVYYFGVRFPNQVTYILQEQWFSLVFTLILIIAIGFFLFSTSVILRQKRLSELQKDFINNMTHEFKTPLSSIQIGATTLLKEPDVQNNKKYFQYLTIIKNQSQRLNENVERVLQIAKVGQKGFQLKKESVRINSMVEDVAITFQDKIDSVNGEIYLDLCTENPLVDLDVLHFNNALANLIDNSIKYTTKAPRIEVRTLCDHGQVQLQIVDNGIGMTDDQLNHVFHQFYRVPTGNLHNQKGFGLGLYYVNEVSKAHNWKLSADSQPDHGTTMTIQIK